MISTAFCVLSSSVEAMSTRPSSWTSILQPVRSTIERIVLPPGPMMSRILSLLIVMVRMRGAYGEMFSRGASIEACIASKISSRALRACSSALDMISLVMPPILMSICSAVMPSRVPATLKSMSPWWSSAPAMSVSTSKRSPALIRPIAMPATGALIGTPASISASEPPQTVAIEEEPFDSRMSETTRIVYGQSSSLGIETASDRSPNAP